MKISEVERLHTAGHKGLEDLARLADALGYNTEPQQLLFNNGCSVSGILNMLEDNPGMIEAMYNFILDNANIYDGLEKESDEEEESDDLPTGSAVD